jgi:uncharacterized protein
MGGARTAVVREDGTVVCGSCIVADNPVLRLRGLLGRRLIEGEGLLLRPASAIHTWFMRFPIDAVFLDRQLVVVSVSDRLRPWRFAGRRGARSVLELADGESERRGIRPGDQLRLERDGVL